MAPPSESSIVSCKDARTTWPNSRRNETTHSYLIRFFLRMTVLFAFGGILVFTTSSNSWAQSSEAQKRKARRLFREGKRLAIQKKFKLALQKYLQAVSLLRRAEQQQTDETERQKLRQGQAAFLYIIGRTYELDGQLILALRHYRESIASNPRPDIDRKAKGFLSQLLAKVQVTLRIDSNPPRVRVALSDEKGGGLFGKTPFVAQIDPGRVQIVLTSPGYAPHREWLNLKPGARLKRTFTLQKTEATTPPTATGNQATTPKPNNLPRKNGLKVASGDPPKSLRGRIPPPPGKPVRWQPIAAYSALGLAIAGVAIGAICLGLAAGDYQEAQTMKGNPQFTTPQVAERIAAGDTKRAVGIVGLILAAGGTAATIVFFMMAKRSNTTTATLPQQPPASLAHTLLDSHSQP